MCSHGLDDDGVDDEDDGDWSIVSNDDDDDDDYLRGARYGGIDGTRGWEIVKRQEIECELLQAERSTDADAHADLHGPYEDEDEDKEEVLPQIQPQDGKGLLATSREDSPLDNESRLSPERRPRLRLAPGFEGQLSR
ncbi:uncharacterized protein A1O5_07954 [Cladophialophora psammophila CBS 110553]|uniref:Uncharacterized protein n=1 Tax=Cladophialophora psammophila CBS 110553 TaxID=1182543 RepID=W9XF64_9EURO|nr:uncharacterized protein A1O5_07954 [Cladophialophora psammophila CBS 110553]EXJ69019.1 hypothetical protein A1O5_07954 [Cladophialophora psammophila CBS 110553]